ARAVIAGVEAVLRQDGLPAGSFDRVVHATTLFTNALIERKGAKTALITTEGFCDTLEIGRERKYELYDVFIEPPAPLVPRNLRREVPERVRADGSVLRPLDRGALEASVRRLVAEGVESVAILFLHSYANPAHEAQAAAIVAEAAPGLFVTASSEIVRELR